MTDRFKDEEALGIRPEPLRNSAQHFSTSVVRDAPLTGPSQLSASPTLHSRGIDPTRPTFDKIMEPENPTGMQQPTAVDALGTVQEMTPYVFPVSPPESGIQTHNSASAIFSRTIVGLEDLLKEALEMAQGTAQAREDEGIVTPAKPDIVARSASERKSSLQPAEIGLSLLSDVQPTPQEASLEPTRKRARPAIPQRFHRLGSFKTSDIEAPAERVAKSSATEIRTASHDWAQPFLRSRSQQVYGPRNEHKPLMAPSPDERGKRKPSHRSPHAEPSQEYHDRLRKAHESQRRMTQPTILPRSASTRPRRTKPYREYPGHALEPKATITPNAQALEQSEDPSPGSMPTTADCFEQMFHLVSSHKTGQGFPEEESRHINLDGRRHVDIKEPHSFNVHETWKHQPVARDWAISRKRFAATIACANAALIGIIIGIYAGEVPAIQYVVADVRHQMILGNTFLYLGLSIPTLCLWPLPLMHGRKPYIIMALAVAMCLQIPQGIAVSDYRAFHSIHRKSLLVSRAMSGLSLGFVNINIQATLLDVFGASLQSSNPHEETVDPFDVRRHGGGMGLWLGIWCWCFIGTISLGFFIGTLFVYREDVSWGFWTSLLLMMLVLLLNVISPEVRRSAYRRTAAEVTGDEGNVRRVSRGEIKMHMKSAGPYWWGEEVKAGMILSWSMLQQPGFAVMAVYAGWVYAHFTLVLMLLGALTSRYYKFKPVQVGLCVLGLGIGALVATPFQKASLFSRARRHRQRTDSMTLQVSFGWSSHLLRRAIFTLLLPFAGIAYVLASKGSSISVAVPTFFAACVGFLSNLTLAECQGILMETFDTSDLQPGMTGRPNPRPAGRGREQCTKFSCYPRISAGIAVTQSLSFCFAAVATAACGRVERRLGAMQATGVVAGVLMCLTLLLTLVLVRFRVVQMIPDALPTMEHTERSKVVWEPVVLGCPSGTMRKISILESGDLTRWSEIRLRNRLITPGSD